VDRDLELNSIDRYVKRSPQFVLEEHSHCEVPAGCGGVVLRWSNPTVSVPVLIEHWFGGDRPSRTIRIDGVRPSTSRPHVPPGRHVFMAEVHAAHGEPLLFLMRATGGGGPQPVLVSQPGIWRWTHTPPPGDAWDQVGYDDSGWQLMTAAPASAEPSGYPAERLLGADAVMLAAPGADRVWIRATFDVAAEG
jgi:hypothetical protein